jgi:uncharacterized protein
MQYLLVTVAALVASGLTFFSGFGLGTILMPVFAIFFPVEVAIAATAVVHFANNVFKMALVGRDAHWPTVWQYGIAAAAAAMVGALVLEWLGSPPPLLSYELRGRVFHITTVKLVIAFVIAGFAIMEMWPGFERVAFPKKLIWVGGLVSGFFGGLSGHQGALRSAFLLRAGLTKAQFVGTRVVGAVIVDASRLVVYALAAVLAMRGRASMSPVETLSRGGGWGLIAAATAAAFIGSFVGSRLVKSVTMGWLRKFVGGMLLLLALAIGFGLV